MPAKKYEPPDPRRGYTIQTREDATAGKTCQWLGLELNSRITVMSNEIFDMTFLTYLSASNNRLTRLPSCISNLFNLEFLDVSNNCLEELPKELGDLLNLRELHLRNNQLRELPFELGRLFQLKGISVDGNPFAQEYPISRYDVNSILLYLLDGLQVAPQPPQRQWTQISSPLEQGFVGSGEKFTVMSYNVLCDKYTTRALYGYCPSWALLWPFRRDLIFKELSQTNADIISLQEVEYEQFHNFFDPKLTSLGYDGIFDQKSRAKTMSESDAKHVDGCAIFFKRQRFRLIHRYTMEFNQLAVAQAEGSSDMLNRVMPKDNIGIAALLEVKQLTGQLRSAPSPPDVLVANVHVHWDPEYCDVKLIQTILMMRELGAIVDEAIKERQRNPALGVRQIPLVMCGDLNSIPKSGVVDYLQNGELSIAHPDFKENQYKGFLDKNVLPDKPGKSSTSSTAPMIGHAFNLSRVFEKEHALRFTNLTHDFTNVIDYIFHTSGFLQPRFLLGAPDETWLKDNKIIGFPHPHYPSDHIPLVAEFELCIKTNSGATRAAGRNRQS